MRVRHRRARQPRLTLLDQAVEPVTDAAQNLELFVDASLRRLRFFGVDSFDKPADIGTEIAVSRRPDRGGLPPLCLRLKLRLEQFGLGRRINVEPIPPLQCRAQRLAPGFDPAIVLEVRALLNAATGRMRPLLDVLVHCGLRASELRALRWSDVDFQTCRLHVRQRADKWNVVGPLKSGTSYRSIRLPPMMIGRLKEWRLACPKGELDLVFPNQKGNVQSLANLTTRALAPLQVKAGVVAPVLDANGQPVVDDTGKPITAARYGVHAFRHFHASWLIAQGKNIRRVATLMGHSSPVITLSVYSHLLPPEDEQERAAASELALVG